MFFFVPLFLRHGFFVLYKTAQLKLVLYETAKVKLCANLNILGEMSPVDAFAHYASSVNSRSGGTQSVSNGYVRRGPSGEAGNWGMHATSWLGQVV